MIYFDNIKISSDAGGYLNDTSSQLRESSRRDIEAGLYGEDLAIFSTSDLLISQSVEGVDLATARGIGNLAQALHHRLITERGTVPEDPTIGIPWSQFLGKTYKNKSYIFAEMTDIIVEELSRDDRISSVDDISLMFRTPNVLEVYISVSAISGGTVSVQLNVNSS